MKKISKENLERGEFYLVFVGYEWSPSGYDIAKYDGKNLDSQTINEDLFRQQGIKIYELPIN